MELYARPFLVVFLQIAIVCTRFEIFSEVFDGSGEKLSGRHISRLKDSPSSWFMPQSLYELSAKTILRQTQSAPAGLSGPRGRLPGFVLPEVSD